jgi:hypothetical protein
MTAAASKTLAQQIKKKEKKNIIASPATSGPKQAFPKHPLLPRSKDVRQIT